MAGSARALEDEPFSYRETAQGKVLISWRGRQVMVLKGPRAAAFLARLTCQDELVRQLAMAKITGNFKRGNERCS